jgi:hypothetical protein
MNGQGWGGRDRWFGDISAIAKERPRRPLALGSGARTGPSCLRHARASGVRLFVPPLLGLLMALTTAGCSLWGAPATPTPSYVPSPTPTPSPTPPKPSGTFTRIGTVASRGDGYTATLLADGRVLIAGGTDSAYAALSSAELYDPRTDTFAPADSMTTGRTGHTATLLKDGRVLIAGGASKQNGDFLASAEVYDPRTDTFWPTGSLGTARESHTATLLKDGSVLIVGGDQGCVRAECVIVLGIETYDPGRGVFSAAGKLATPRAGHTATPLLDGRVLIVGGQDTKGHPISSAEVYNPGLSASAPTGSLLRARSGHTAALLLEGRVLIAGGLNEASAELYDPVKGIFEPVGSMTTARAFHGATTLLDGRVLVAGGVIATGDAAASDPASAELYDPPTGSFSRTGSMTTARSGQLAVRLIDGRVFIFGRDHASGGTSHSAEFYQP